MPVRSRISPFLTFKVPTVIFWEAIYVMFILASYCFIMHERLFHGCEMSKSARNVSNILYAEARKHPANLLLHMILNDDEFEKVAKGWDSMEHDIDVCDLC